MFTSQNNKRAVENFLVQDITATVATIGLGNDLVNTATGAINLDEKQIGVFDSSGYGSNNLYDEVVAAQTIANSPVIQIMQGTAGSANPAAIVNKYPLWTRPYEASSEINGRNFVHVTKQVAETPSHSTWLIGATPATTGALSAADSTEYGLTIAYRGRDVEEMYGGEQAASFAPSYITPDYTALGTTNSLDHLIQNLTWDINRNSKVIAVNRTRFRGNDPIVGFAINTVGNTGAGAGTRIATLTAGTFVPVVNTQFGIRGITVTQAMVDSIKAAGAAYGDASILTIDLTTAGTIAAAADVVAADAMILMALDRTTSYEDRIPQVKNRIKVGLTLGFDYTQDYHKELSFAYEGQGVGRTLELQFQATHNQRKYNLNHRQVPVIKFPSDIDESLMYDTYVIEHVSSRVIDTVGNTSHSPAKEIILFPTEGTGVISTPGNSAAETAFEAILNPWLASGNHATI
jgi:hypothetical protein